MQQDTLYGFVIEATIGKGKIISIDTHAAEKAPGVALILTYRNSPDQGTGNHRSPTRSTTPAARIRDYPITLDKILSKLPMLA
jgi:CO/xanthine dehydrogenase Mo-binding subunit